MKIFKSALFLIGITAILIQVSCQEQKDENDVSNLNSLNFDALSASMKTDIKSFSIDNSMLKGNSAPIFGPPTSRNELSDMKCAVKVLTGSKNAGVAVPGFAGLTLGKDESCLSAYYVETATDGDSVYGIGYSVHYLFRKLKKGLSLTNLPQIAASVQLESKKTEVVYAIQTYGIKSLTLVNSFKPVVNQNFDVDGFALMQSKIDGIHNVLSDSILSAHATFTPKLLDLRPTELK